MVDGPPPAVALPRGRRVWWSSVRKWALFASVLLVVLVIGAAKGLRESVSLTRGLFFALFVLSYILCIVVIAALVLGRPLDELDVAWDEMALWRRGVLSVVFAALAIAMIA